MLYIVHRIDRLPWTRRLGAGAFSILLAVLLVACGSAEDDEAPDADQPAAVEPAAAATGGDSADPTVPEGSGAAQGVSIYAGTGGPGFGGDGEAATAAELYGPAGLAVDDEGNVYIATDNRVRRVDAKTGIIETIAGTGTPGYKGDGESATDANLKVPAGLVIDKSGNLLIADSDNGRIRKVDVAAGVITTLAGGGIPKRVGGVLDTGDGGAATDAWFKKAADVDVDDQGNVYFIADNRVRKIDTSGIISTIAGTGKKGHEGDGGPAVEGEMADPNGIAVDPEGKFVYVADTGNHRVRQIDLTTGVITTLAGKGTVALGAAIDPMRAAAGTREGGGGAGFEGDGGPSVDALLAQPKGVSIAAGKLYIADTGNDRIRVIDLATGIINTAVDGGAVLGEKMQVEVFFDGQSGGGGTDTMVTFANFAPPRDVVATAGGTLFIADVRENKVVRFEP